MSEARQSEVATERGAKAAYEFWRRNQPNGIKRYVPWSRANDYTRRQWLWLAQAVLKAAADA